MNGAISFINSNLKIHNNDKPSNVRILFYTLGFFKPEYVSKMDFYLERLDRQLRKTDENPSVGLLLCASKNDEVVEYAMSRTLSPMI